MKNIISRDVNLTSENKYSLMLNNDVKTLGDYIIKNKISLSELKWEILEKSDKNKITDELVDTLLEISDYIIGIYYDTI